MRSWFDSVQEEMLEQPNVFVVQSALNGNVSSALCASEAEAELFAERMRQQTPYVVVLGIKELRGGNAD